MLKWPFYFVWHRQRCQLTSETDQMTSNQWRRLRVIFYIGIIKNESYINFQHIICFSAGFKIFIYLLKQFKVGIFTMGFYLENRVIPPSRISLPLLHSWHVKIMNSLRANPIPYHIHLPYMENDVIGLTSFVLFLTSSDNVTDVIHNKMVV